MLKKLLLSLTAFIFLAIAAVVVTVFIVAIDRPDEVPEIKSEIYQSEFNAQSKIAQHWLQSIYENNKLPSLSAAVGVNGNLVWSGVIGYADLEQKTVADSNTQYRIGSISKTLTASAVMRMSEKDEIDINSAFNEYVEGFSNGADYTIKHLLTHQAGIRHYTSFSENLSTKNYADTKAAASIVQHDALLFAPGTGFNYSTYGYTLLALAIESASSLRFEDLMLKEVFAPLKMDSTHVEKHGESENKKIAEPYIYVGEVLIEAPDVNLSDRYAGGGFLSTPSDLVSFGNALLGNEFLTTDTKNLLWTPVPLANGVMNPQSYALGFRVGEDQHGAYVHHGGTSNGGYSFLLIYPVSGVVVAFTSNISLMDPAFDRLDAAKQLVKIFSAQR